MFAESGIVGGVAWILFLFRSLRISRRNFIHATDKSIKSYSFGIHVSLLIFSIGGGFWVITPSHELFALMIVLVALSACINTINSNSGGGSSEVALA
jgi:ABC-type uncharacterized transport system YnjBCD permease subunit